jgi:hypothetical protein
MPHTCGGERRADNGGLGRSDAESVIAMFSLLSNAEASRRHSVIPANAGTHTPRRMS